MTFAKRFFFFVLLCLSVPANAETINGALNLGRAGTQPIPGTNQATIYFDGTDLLCAQDGSAFFSFCGPSTAPTSTPTTAPTATPTLAVGGCRVIDETLQIWVCKNVFGDERLEIGGAGNSDPSNSLVSGGLLQELVAKSGGYARAGTFAASNTAAESAQHFLMRSRGTLTSPADVQIGDVLGTFIFGGYTAGAITPQSFTLEAIVSDSPGVGFIPVDLIFGSVDAAGLTHDPLILRDTGHVCAGCDAGNPTRTKFTVAALGLNQQSVLLTGDTAAMDAASYSTVSQLGGPWVIQGATQTFAEDPGDGQVLVVSNVDGTFPLVIKNEDAAASAQHRFHMSTGADISVPVDDSIAFIYDYDILRWRNFARPIPTPFNTPGNTVTPILTPTPANTATVTATFTAIPPTVTPNSCADPCAEAVDWTRLQNYPTACSAGSFISTLADVPTCTSNASTATALAANGANCSPGSYPLGVDASGAVESCTAVGSGTVTSVATGVGLTGGTITTTGTVALSYADTLASNSLGAGECVFASGTNERGIICEGATADGIEIALKFPDPATSDKTLTAPNETGTLCSTGSVCSGYQAGPLSGDVVTSGAAATIQANSVALGTDTTGNYAGSSSEGGAATTADALTTNPSPCSSNQYVTDIAAAGTLTCAQPDVVNLAGITHARRTTDFTTTSTSAVDITSLSFSVLNGEVWAFEFHLSTASTTAAGLTLALSTPAGVTGGQYFCSLSSATASRAERGVSTGACNTVNGDGIASFSGIVAPSANGTVQLRIAKTTSGTATVYTNSYLLARRIS